EVLDLAFELGHVVVADAQLRLGQITDHRHDAAFAITDLVLQLIDLAQGRFAHQHIDGSLTLEQVFQQKTPDKTCCSRYKITHVDLLIVPLTDKTLQTKQIRTDETELTLATTGRKTPILPIPGV